MRYDNYGTYYGDYGYPTGELRLQVRPRDAQVFVDGAYAGTVDEFDGTFQSLRLEGGEYQVELVLPGYEPLDFDVRITPGEKVTYRADLIPEQQPQAAQLPIPDSQKGSAPWKLGIGLGVPTAIHIIRG